MGHIGGLGGETTQMPVVGVAMATNRTFNHFLAESLDCCLILFDR